jgi:protein regulator of cytokinesis 1
MKKATRARRESFKPRPSIDDRDGLGAHGRWGGLAGSVREEDEGY